MVCNDIMDPKYGFNAEKKEILQHSMKMYMGIDIIIDSGKTGTLVIASRECRQFSPFDIAFAAEICGCIDDKYRMRRDARASGAVSNLTICSVLLSGIKGYIGAAMDCLDQIGEAFRDIRRSQSSTSSMSDDFQELKSLVERFESHKTNVQSSIDRALNVAKNYTSNDKKEYFLSCFQSQPEGFIQVCL